MVVQAAAQAAALAVVVQAAVAVQAAALAVVVQAAAVQAAAGGGAEVHRLNNQSDLTTCAPGMVWDTKRHKCLIRHSSVLPDSELTEYAYALAKADRYQEAIDVLDLLNNPDTPRALNYRGYAIRKLGRTDEGLATISNRSRSIPVIRRCANILGKPMSFRASSISPKTSWL